MDHDQARTPRLPLRANLRHKRLVASMAMALLTCCGDNCGGGDELDTRFDIPRTEVFPDNLSAYALYTEEMSALEPAPGVHLYELSSKLFTDYATKQRLIKLPEGQRATVIGSRQVDYPDGTIVAKTFSYPNDFRDESLGRRVIETRVMVKRAGQWNVATYVWDDTQTDASLALEGETTTVSWVSNSGEARSTEYEIPGEIACVTCHQHSDSVALLGLRPRDLNRTVSRHNEDINQIDHLSDQGVLEGVSSEDIETIVDHTDTSETTALRARAYLDMNCSHCHNPNAWERSAEQGLDLRYETSLGQSGLRGERDGVQDVLREGEMPYIGTTVLDEEGVALVLDYLESL